MQEEGRFQLNHAFMYLLQQWKYENGSPYVLLTYYPCTKNHPLAGSTPVQPAKLSTLGPQVVSPSASGPRAGRPMPSARLPAGRKLR